MSVDTTMAVLYAQTGLGTQFANTAAVTPHASLSMTRVIAMATAEQEKTQVEKTNEAENTGISKDGQKKKKAEQFGTRRRRQAMTSDAENQDSAGIPSYTGNLLNLTV